MKENKIREGELTRATAPTYNMHGRLNRLRYLSRPRDFTKGGSLFSFVGVADGSKVIRQPPERAENYAYRPKSIQ